MATAIPVNTASFSVDEIVRATGASIVVRGATHVGHVSTDSRAVGAGGLFVALSGERHDAHDFLPSLQERQLGAVLVSRRDVVAPPGATVLLVDDTTRALGALARLHRDRWGGRVVAITGSAGKTTTRRAAAALLAGGGRRVHASSGNLNNLVGAPMVLLGLTAAHDTAVVELGTSAPGEIARLAELARPDLGVLTLVALAHASGLGSLDEIEREKGALLRALGEGAQAVVNADDPRARAAVRASRATPVLYGHATDADVRIVSRAPRGVSGSTLELAVGSRSLVVETPLLGRAGALATAAAVAICRAELGHLPDAQAISGALLPLGAEATSRLTATLLSQDIVLIDDSYNANRASMESSIEAASELAAARAARLVLVLGEMKELGAASAGEHAAVGRAAAAASPGLVVAVGGAARGILDEVPGRFGEDAAAAAAALLEALRPGDVVLVKGSRSVGLERVVSAVTARFAPVGGAA